MGPLSFLLISPSERLFDWSSLVMYMLILRWVEKDFTKKVLQDLVDLVGAEHLRELISYGQNYRYGQVFILDPVVVLI